MRNNPCYTNTGFSAMQRETARLQPAKTTREVSMGPVLGVARYGMGQSDREPFLSLGLAVCRTFSDSSRIVDSCNFPLENSLYRIEAVLSGNSSSWIQTRRFRLSNQHSSVTRAPDNCLTDRYSRWRSTCFSFSEFCLTSESIFLMT